MPVFFFFNLLASCNLLPIPLLTVYCLLMTSHLSLLSSDTVLDRCGHLSINLNSLLFFIFVYQNLICVLTQFCIYYTLVLEQLNLTRVKHPVMLTVMSHLVSFLYYRWLCSLSPQTVTTKNHPSFFCSTITFLHII